ncbi:MAG TPA: sugar transferase [Clostridiales bacterium]|nr:sugar transferase [Clostridiales bacterium]
MKEKRPRAGYCGFYNRIIKRIVDFILSLIAAVAVTPIVFVIGIFVAIEDGFPVLYTPLRGGYRGKAFRIFKLRTMYKDADKLGGTTALNDPRITRMGKALRKLKLDELPQVYNVLLGSMSFIGPRPELLHYTEAYKDEEKIILEVRPGITDFSSIEFISLDEIIGTENADEMYEKYVLEKKNKLRIRYAKEVSFGTDVSLFFKTVTAVFKKAMRVVGKSNREK